MIVFDHVTFSYENKIGRRTGKRDRLGPQGSELDAGDGHLQVVLKEQATNNKQSIYDSGGSLRDVSRQNS